MVIVSKESPTETTTRTALTVRVGVAVRRERGLEVDA